MVAELIETNEIAESNKRSSMQKDPTEKKKKTKKTSKDAANGKKKSSKKSSKEKKDSTASGKRKHDNATEQSFPAIPTNNTVEMNGTDEEIPKKRAKQVSSDDTKEITELSAAEREGAFTNFAISEQTLKCLSVAGYKYLFPIQAKTFNIIMEGTDVFGKARTGTGKTLSFTLPVVERLLAEQIHQRRGRQPRVLVMAPTRELAIQVGREFEKIGPSLASTTVYGGTDYEPQRRAMRDGLDAIIGTPGRLLDHLESGNLSLSGLQYLVLDEADRMLEVGFVEAIEKILNLVLEQAGKKPQMILFSATLPSFIKSTLKKYMPNHKVIDTVGSATNRTSTGVEHLALCCPWKERNKVIADVVQVYSGAHGRTMIFTQTKKDANELGLNDTLKQDVQVLHGDIAQKQREISLQSFRDGKVRCLVATDVAARGIDIPEVDLVVQCEPPKDVESYIHRSGRTGRAGRTGTCICFYKTTQEQQLRGVERRAGIRFRRIGPPQPADIIKASARDATRFLDEIPPDVLQHFHDAAKTLIEEKGSAVDALAAALAHISGSTSIKGRSLLSSMEGFTAFHLSVQNEIRAKSFVYSMMERYVSHDVREAIRGLRLQKDHKGAVFDLPTEMVSTVKEFWSDTSTIQLRVADILPELEQDMRSGFSNGGGYGRRNGGSFSRGGGGFRNGNRRGGYGRGGYGRGGGFHRRTY